MTTLITSTGTLLTFLMLLTPLIFPSPMNPMLQLKNTIKKTFIISLCPSILLLGHETEITIKMAPMIFMDTQNIYIDIILDTYSILFTSIALFITWSIMEFSTWYMSQDPNITKFLKYLTTFLLTMLIIISANNFYQFFIGWEGVGIMSFLLIGWWFARTDAGTAALQAIIYNRLGDIGLLLAMLWLNAFSSWNFQEIFMQENQYFTLPTLGLLLGAIGKSAQLGLHPWLPAAMEGPTPVSALLHSSTMVVAGVFLILRMHPIMQNNHTILTLCLLIGSFTTLVSAIVATTQNDIKKIIALSTTSQLGLMMVTLGLNQPMLTFMHMTMHSFFKATLFLCAGSLIHNLNNEQDIRKMGNLMLNFPATSSAMTTASMALMGAPFLSGFYSKDIIIETITNSNTNAWAMTLTLVATALSATYSTRMIILVQTGTTKIKQTHTHHESKTALNSIARLTMGSIMAGLLTKLMISPSTSILTMPKPIKLAALMISLFSMILTMDIISSNKMKMKPMISHSTNQFLFFNTMHRAFPLGALNTSQNLSTELMDTWTLEKFGPKGLATKNISMTHLSTQQKTMIKHYLSIFLLSTTITLIFLSPNWS
uniref:NADH-ubiquinone oxidoreductase chain 5 n=1 Tax=Indotyphlops braminus TaxID=51846 RepID=A9X4G2_9SAUR|nr:NADH dehydrogenase subunit 5 [Indotyphlops braminus]ABC55927.1 NADH dehydrogenase subunit 5 [Indotyphlops braminus]